MDYLFTALLAAAALLGGGLLILRNRRPPTAPLGRSPAVSPATEIVWHQTALDLDPQTRFIDSPRKKTYRLLNDAEQTLHARLCEAMPAMRIFAQVGVAQLALARSRHEAQRLARMAGRGVDFVVCDADFAIIAAIELAWPTHGTASPTAEDEKRTALQSLGIPLIVFRPNDLPDADAISREIADAILRRKRLEAERG